MLAGLLHTPEVHGQDGQSVDEAVLDMKFMACDVHGAQQDQGLEFWQ